MRALHPRTSSLAFAFGMALLSLACGNDHDAGTPHDPEQEIGCAQDPRAQRYVPGVSVAGKRYRFVLDEAVPAPPARGENRWTVEVLDGAAPVSGLALDAVPFMPDHNHGPAELPVIEPTADQRFIIDAIDFFMPGLWRVTVSATAGDIEDTAEFYFCVAG